MADYVKAGAWTVVIVGVLVFIAMAFYTILTEYLTETAYVLGTIVVLLIGALAFFVALWVIGWLVVEGPKRLGRWLGDGN